MYAIPSDHFLLQRRWRIKERERNILAAMLSIVVIATLSTALVQPRWFYLKGGGCTRKYIGVQEFFYIGYFQTAERQSSNGYARPPSFIYYGLSEEMKDCVTPEIVSLLRTLIAVCFLAIVTSLMQFFMDSMGVMYKWLQIIRRNALGNIITVVFCIGVIGTCYYISTLMEQQQEATKVNRNTLVEVQFDISYYLIAAAGATSLLAAAANLLRRHTTNSDMTESLLDDCDGMETFSVGISHSELWPYRQDFTRMQNLPPLPPYSP